MRRSREDWLISRRVGLPVTTDPMVAVDVVVDVAVVAVVVVAGAPHRLWLLDVVAEAWALCLAR